MAGLVCQREAIAPELNRVLLRIKACVHAHAPLVDPQRPVDVTDAKQRLHIFELECKLQI